MRTDGPIQYDPDRKLTPAQKDINDDPRYWDWFDAWWAQNFSWNGLAKRKIRGWDDGRTLQGYWREEKNRLIDFAGRTWTRFHLPPHDRSGEKKSGKFGFTKDTWKEPKWQDWRDTIVQKLKAASKCCGPKSTDKRAQITGVCFPAWFDLSVDPKKGASQDIIDKRLRRIRADWAQFGDKARFDHAQFGDDTRFDYAQFGGNASFYHALFGNKTNFRDAHFWDKANFSEAHFGNWASFTEAQFEVEVNFTEVHFGDKVNFSEVQFGDEVSFTEAQFVGWASFTKAKFGDEVSFTKAKFGDEVSFIKAKFGSWTSFTEAQFGNRADFSKAQFHGPCLFSGNPSIAARKALKKVRGLFFTGTVFHKVADFSDRVFPKSTTFRGAHFHKLAKFHGCSFHQDTSFADTIFETPNKNLGLMEDFWLSRAGYVDETLDPYQRAFQTLRLHMDQLRQFGQEMKFAKLEMQARERRFGSKDTPFWVRALSRAYGRFADYGQSALWPLLWLGGFYGLAAGIYTLIAGAWASPGAALEVAFRYALPPLTTFAGQFFAGEVDPVFVNALLDHPFLTRLVMTLHALLSAVMVFFALLALKRRFQIR